LDGAIYFVLQVLRVGRSNEVYSCTSKINHPLKSTVEINYHVFEPATEFSHPAVCPEHPSAQSQRSQSRSSTPASLRSVLSEIFFFSPHHPLNQQMNPRKNTTALIFNWITVISAMI
jgi:hypothetical protein